MKCAAWQNEAPGNENIYSIHRLVDVKTGAHLGVFYVFKDNHKFCSVRSNSVYWQSSPGNRLTNSQVFSMVKRWMKKRGYYIISEKESLTQ